jgi:hypothetical protein
MFPPRRISNAVLGLFVLATACSAAAGAGPSPALTKEALKARVKQAQQIVFEDEFRRAVAELKALGPAPRLQQMLSELYPDGDAKEKVTVLRLLEAVGVEHTVKALPAIAADYAVARPKPPNDMSFAGFYVLEKYLRLAWKKLPPAEGVDRKKDAPVPPKTPEPPAEHTLNAVAPDEFTHTGSPADRKTIRRHVLENKLHIIGPKARTYPVPPAADTDWVRIIGSHAFVRLRGPSSGVDYLFLKSKDGKWCYLATLGYWVN